MAVASRPRAARTSNAMPESSGEGIAPLATSDPNRWEILRAAAEAFMEHGYAATSIDTVAEVLGATKGRIYYCYKSKADLFFDIHHEAMLLNVRTIRPIANSDSGAPVKLRGMIEAHLELIVNHLPLQRVSIQGVEMHLSSSTTPQQRVLLESLIAMRDEYERLFVQVLNEGIDAGEFRKLDTKIVVKLLLGGLNWVCVWYKPRPNQTAKAHRSFIDESANFLLRGVEGLA
jgi:AcrR family transcriptional regulator